MEEMNAQVKIDVREEASTLLENDDELGIVELPAYRMAFLQGCGDM